MLRREKNIKQEKKGKRFSNDKEKSKFTNKYSDRIASIKQADARGKFENYKDGNM